MLLKTERKQVTDEGTKKRRPKYEENHRTAEASCRQTATSAGNSLCRKGCLAKPEQRIWCVKAPGDGNGSALESREW